ncbi:MAG: hypothetical protein KAU17_00330 [Spirochaetales bacterium]|nr:hypothetical protein [Spirochaetales bacterium]
MSINWENEKKTLKMKRRVLTIINFLLIVSLISFAFIINKFLLILLFIPVIIYLRILGENRKIKLAEQEIKFISHRYCEEKVDVDIGKIEELFELITRLRGTLKILSLQDLW